MTGPVTIENDHIAMKVWPARGAWVSSVVDKLDDVELLLQSGDSHSAPPLYDDRFDGAGWVECFPAVAAGPYVGRPYDGIAIPDHGELWTLPVTAVPARAGITTVWHGLRFGYRFVRKLTLDESSIVADYTLVNLAPLEFRFVWAQHALLSRRSDVLLNDQLLPAAMSKTFEEDPITVQMRIDYPHRDRRLTLAYASADGVNAYWGIWNDPTGPAGKATFAVGPTTGRHDALAPSVADTTAGRVGASATVRWSTRWTLSDVTSTGG